MAIGGTWKTSRQQLTAIDASQQGHGYNAVHSSRNAGMGRNIDPTMITGQIPNDVVDQFQPSNYGYAEEDFTVPIFGDNTETGMADHPDWGMGAGRSDVTDDWPSYGPRPGGVPGGVLIRARNHGADVTIHMKGQQPPALDSPEYKRYGEVENAVVSDPSQLQMQTSGTQRDATRNGSQTSGRANAVRAAIKSRIPGRKLPTYSDGYRHAEMVPRGQSATRPNPAFYRTAGTANPEWMGVNAATQALPRQREPVPEPYIGADATPSPVAAAGVFGYSDEDVLPYV